MFQDAQTVWREGWDIPSEKPHAPWNLPFWCGLRLKWMVTTTRVRTTQPLPCFGLVVKLTISWRTALGSRDVNGRVLKLAAHGLISQPNLLFHSVQLWRVCSVVEPVQVMVLSPFQGLAVTIYVNCKGEFKWSVQRITTVQFHILCRTKQLESHWMACYS